MRTRKTLVLAAGIAAAAMALAISVIPEVTQTTTVKTNEISYSELSAGIQSVLDEAVDSENDVHEEITEVLNQGVVQNNLPGYDWNEMAIANVEDTVNMRENPD